MLWGIQEAVHSMIQSGCRCGGGEPSIHPSSSGRPKRRFGSAGSVRGRKHALERAHILSLSLFSLSFERTQKERQGGTASGCGLRWSPPSRHAQATAVATAVATASCGYIYGAPGRERTRQAGKKEKGAGGEKCYALLSPFTFASHLIVYTSPCGRSG